MNNRIQRATDYIESHLHDELSVALLAGISAYSEFHFCRVFKAQVGESVMAYTQRLRLEASSAELSFGHKPLIDVAFDTGFETPTGFLKAFKKRFGMTPTDYKRQSKDVIKKYQDIAMKKPELVTREVTHVVFARERGDYFKSSDVAWERLSAELNDAGEKHKDQPPTDGAEFSLETAELIGICYDNPEVTAEEKIRYDACIGWSEVEIAILRSAGLQTKTIAGGKYIKVLHKGSYESSESSWYGLYAWLEKEAFELRDEPAFEKYLNTPDKVEPSELLTEIYVPVR